jgi:hypothetical protein
MEVKIPKHKGKITFKAGQEHRAALVKIIEKFLPRFSIWQVWDKDCCCDGGEIISKVTKQLKNITTHTHAGTIQKM